ncbi:MAG: TrmB family transcriptional regulator [Anaerolineae bacterium]|jgi:sugar-specific transcriptional regulator TrmB|nr:TrmB family transcriptional regulator [Anaerolineae bacterium]
MGNEPVSKLVEIGFSEYEAKAYVALLRENPATGYQLAKLSGVPRSMVYEALGKLVSRGAAMTLRKGETTQYAPVPPEEFLDQLHREHEELIDTLKDDLVGLASPLDLEYVWNFEGNESVMAKAEEMILQAQDTIYLALVPSTFSELRPILEEAVGRGVRVVIYTTADIDLPGARVVVAHVSEETLGQARGLGLILSIDGEEVLIGEWLSATQARASWTNSPFLVFLAEHHLRTDLYLPRLLACLGDEALELIQEEDRELFTRAMESRVEC